MGPPPVPQVAVLLLFYFGHQDLPLGLEGLGGPPGHVVSVIHMVPDHVPGLENERRKNMIY